MEEPADGGVDAFAAAGRTLVSLGMVRGTEGNLSTFDGRVLRITRSGCSLGALGSSDVLNAPGDDGALRRDLPGASPDLRVHQELYRTKGPGAVVHAHPVGTVPEEGGGPGAHGVYVHAGSLPSAVDEAVTQARRTAEVPR